MNVFKLEFRQTLKSLLLWSLIVGAVGVLFICFYPSMENSSIAALANTKMEGLTSSFFAVFGMQTIPDFTQLDQYFAYCFQYILLVSAFFAALLGARTLIREESEGTIEFLYAQPLSRGNIYRGKLISSLLSLLIFCLIITGTQIAILVLVNGDGNIGEILWQLSIAFIGFAFTCLIFMSLGMFFSAAFRSYKQAVPFTVGLVFLTYLVGILSELVPGAKFLQYFSPIHYSLPGTLLADGFNWISVLVGIGVILLTLIFGSVIYQRKDLRV